MDEDVPGVLSLMHRRLPINKARYPIDCLCIRHYRAESAGTQRDRWPDPGCMYDEQFRNRGKNGSGLPIPSEGRIVAVATSEKTRNVYLTGTTRPMKTTCLSLRGSVFLSHITEH